jgi:hypothetical protein
VWESDPDGGEEQERAIVSTLILKPDGETDAPSY